MAFYRRRPRPDAEKCADPAKARASALETLAGQEISANMLYERLCRRYTEQAAAAAVAEMVQLDYVNDTRYAEARAHSLLAARKSRRAAAQSLRQKGLAPAEVAGALEAVYAPEDGDDPELEAAAALVDSRYRKKLAIGRRDLVVAALQPHFVRQLPQGGALGCAGSFTATAKSRPLEDRLPPAGGRCRVATKGGVWHRRRR